MDWLSPITAAFKSKMMVGVLIGVLGGGVIGICIATGFCLMFFDSVVTEMFERRALKRQKASPRR